MGSGFSRPTSDSGTAASVGQPRRQRRDSSPAVVAGGGGGNAATASGAGAVAGGGRQQTSLDDMANRFIDANSSSEHGNSTNALQYVPYVGEERFDMPIETMSARQRKEIESSRSRPLMSGRMTLQGQQSQSLHQRSPGGAQQQQQAPHGSVEPLVINAGDENSGPFAGSAGDGYYTADEARRYEVHMARPTEAAMRQLSVKWQKGSLIGSGAFGKVYLGMNLGTTELMAVKQIAFTSSSSEATREVEAFRAEVAFLKELDHTNIVKYLGMEVQDDNLNIFLEYVPSGSIPSILKKFGKLQESVIRSYTEQILRGLQYLHNRMIVHRDIKGANILVDSVGTIKLTDFGASKRLEELANHGAGAFPSLRGTPHWMAPEVIRQTCCCRQSDIWSLGCTVIEMATGRPPYSDITEDGVSVLFYIANSANPPPIPASLTGNAAEFLSLCLRFNHRERPNATRLLTHPFINPNVQMAFDTMYDASADAAPAPAAAAARGDERTQSTRSVRSMPDSPATRLSSKRKGPSGEMEPRRSAKKQFGGATKTVIRVQASPLAASTPAVVAAVGGAGPSQLVLDEAQQHMLAPDRLSPTQVDDEAIRQYLKRSTILETERLLTPEQKSHLLAGGLGEGARGAHDKEAPVTAAAAVAAAAAAAAAAGSNSQDFLHWGSRRWKAWELALQQQLMSSSEIPGQQHQQQAGAPQQVLTLPANQQQLQ